MIFTPQRAMGYPLLWIALVLALYGLARLLHG